MWEAFSLIAVGFFAPRAILLPFPPVLPPFLPWFNSSRVNLCRKSKTFLLVDSLGPFVKTAVASYGSLSLSFLRSIELILL